MATRMTFVHAYSPLHAGTGQGVGVIDLPIAREKATGIPYLPGSSLKGTLRSLCPSYCSKEDCDKVFGPEQKGPEIEARASAVQFSDQRLLLLPVRSLAGTFAWVTSPYILQRLKRDMVDAGIAATNYAVPTVDKTETCLLASEKSTLTIDGKAYLEDLDLTASTNQDAKNWADWISQQVFPKDTSGQEHSQTADWQELLLNRFCIVHDDVFNFILTTATEITARIRLQEDSKTVVQGGLWYEEALPTESILSGLVIATSRNEVTDTRAMKVVENMTDKTIQLGGKATVGRGMCRVYLTKEGK